LRVLVLFGQCQAPAPAIAADVFVGPMPSAAASCTVSTDVNGNFILSAGCTAADIFVDAGAGDFHLAANSPAIGRALCLPEVPTDFDGRPRPTPNRPPGQGCDIGAYQFPGGNQPPPQPSNLRILSIQP
jgi:hypothetical protein